jgi:radical SAM protein with 4Fe4S-binding SPASM domain
MTADATLVPDLPSELQIEVTGACNLRCKMCLVSYRPEIGRSEGALSFETVRELVDGNPNLRRVTLQGLGEPLLAPDLFRMIEHASRRGIRMGFNTNGMLLTAARAERLVEAGLSWLHVSLDGATAETYEGIRGRARLSRVAANVRGLVEARRRLGAREPAVALVFVAMRRNVHELPDVVRLGAEWGVDRVWVQNLSHSFDDTDAAGAYRDIRRFAASEALWGDGDRERSERVFADARGEARRLGIALRLPRLDPPSRRPAARGCDWPWQSAYVTHDGTVQPCCMVMGSDRARLGRLGQRTFAEIWSSARYRRFRQGLLGDRPPAVCRGCSAYRRVF